MSRKNGRYRAVAADGSAVAWSDPKRYLWVLGLVVPTLPLVGVAGEYFTGAGLLLWLTPVVFLGVIPLLDLVSGSDNSNPPDEVIEILEKDRFYKVVVFAYLPLQYLGLGTAMWYLGTGDLAVWEKLGLAISVGIVGGVAINTAHELGHKKESLERWVSKVALAQTFYGHFYIEHNRGHHVRVATAEDPASARMGESLYSFLPRTVVGSVRSAWGLEKRRLARRREHPWRISNDVLNAWLMSVVLWGAMLAAFGPSILPWLLIQAVIGFTLLEIVNYMEHYGMLRQKVGVGSRERYERVLPQHSWNSNNVATNVMLYHLQRHSDHHANPTRSFQALRDFRDAPVLPTGYMGMIVVALVPPLFKRLMDRRVVDHYDGDLRLANLAPRRSEKLLRRFPPPSHGLTQGADTAVQASAFADEVLAARCPGCDYTYEVVSGNEAEGFPAGTAWAEIPDNWCCPDCGVREKVDFIAVTSAGV
ncbi:fatty acid desaturase [Nocardioides sp. Bht2]|uniref:fatty acid desaturase n=1 Tax=Nocardioides sp. Bht2 TaxID=3392297 RepID=UPI0039B46148